MRTTYGRFFLSASILLGVLMSLAAAQPLGYTTTIATVDTSASLDASSQSLVFYLVPSDPRFLARTVYPTGVPVDWWFVVADGFVTNSNGRPIGQFGPWGLGLTFWHFGSELSLVVGSDNDDDEDKDERDRDKDDWTARGYFLNASFDTYSFHDPLTDGADRYAARIGTVANLLPMGLEIGSFRFNRGENEAAYVAAIVGPPIMHRKGIEFDGNLKLGVFRDGGVLFEWRQGIAWTPDPHVTLHYHVEWSSIHVNCEGPDLKEVVFRIMIGVTLRLYGRTYG